MTEARTEKILIGILEDITGIEVEPYYTIEGDLELTCFDLPEMGAAIEQEFGVNITDDDLDMIHDNVTTVSDVVKMIVKKRREANPRK